MVTIVLKIADGLVAQFRHKIDAGRNPTVLASMECYFRGLRGVMILL